MNTTLTYFNLPPVEQEIADNYAWGMTAKEIANKRNRSTNTIKNQIRKLFEKTDTHKDTEFTAWYFCTKFHISFKMSPLARQIVAGCLFVLVSFDIINDGAFNCTRASRTLRTRVERAERSGRTRLRNE